METGNRRLEAVVGWKRANKLKPNPDKTVVLLTEGKFDPGNEISPVLDGVALQSF